MQNGFYIFFKLHTHARMNSSSNAHPLHLIFFPVGLGIATTEVLSKVCFCSSQVFTTLCFKKKKLLAQHWAYQYIISLQLFLRRIRDFSDYNLNSSDAPGAPRTLHHNSHISLSGYDISNIPASVYGSQTMKSPISWKPVGGNGWGPGVLFEQAALISDKVCRWDRCPLCQLGPLVLQGGGGGPERSATSQQLHSPGTCLPLPVKTFLSGPHLHPMCSLAAGFQHTHTNCFSSAPYIDSFMSCSQA